MSGNAAGMGQLTGQMKQLQEMQMNLQRQMAAQVHASGPPVGGAGNIGSIITDDDNSFLNEDLPNLAAQIKAIDDTSFDIPKPAPMKRQSSHNSGANQRQSNQNQTNSSQFQPYRLRDFQ